MLHLVCLAVSVSLGSLSTIAQASAIPPYLQTGLAKFASDAGRTFVPQAELMSALVLTGHARDNIREHRLRLLAAGLPGDSAEVKQGKSLVIRPLATLFKAIEDSHNAISTQVKSMMPTPEIINGLAIATTNIAVSVQICKRLAQHPVQEVSQFYREMHDVLQRALGMRAYLVTFGPVLNDSVIDSFLELNEAGNAVVEQTSTSVSEGYSRLTALGATPAAWGNSFTRVEFSHIWEN